MTSRFFGIHIPSRNRMCCRRLVTTATFSRLSGLVLLLPPSPLATHLFFGRPFSCMPFHPLVLLMSCTWHRLWSRSIMFMYVGFSRRMGGCATRGSLLPRQCNSDSHPFLRRATAFVQTNQCPWCSSVLASQQTALQHVRNAFQNGKCRADSDHLATSLKPLDLYQCPECSESFSCVFSYNRHIVQHLPPPTYIEIPDGPRTRSSTSRTRDCEEEAGGGGDLERAQQARPHSQQAGHEQQHVGIFRGQSSTLGDCRQAATSPPASGRRLAFTPRR